MRIDILTLFPDTLGDVLSESILGRAQERGYIQIEAHQIRDYTSNKQNQVDDYPYGGGRGAIMQADPIYRCWEAVCDEAGGPVYTVYMSPCGHTFTQADAIRLSKMENLVLLVGGIVPNLVGLYADIAPLLGPAQDAFRQHIPQRIREKGENINPHRFASPPEVLPAFHFFPDPWRG